MTQKHTTIYLIRHGQTQWNIEKRLQGQLDSPLTKEGINQLETTAQKLATQPISAIYASDLGRATHSAKIIATPHGLSVQTSKALRERDFGPFSKQKAEDFFTTFDQEYTERNSLPKEKRLQFKVHPQIESDIELINRSRAFLDDLIPKHLNEKIVLVSHAGWIRTMLVGLNCASYDDVPFDLIKNGHYFTITAKPGKYHLETSLHQ